MIEARLEPRLVPFSIDGRSVSAPEGSYVLAAAREAGIEIPTLCDDPALEPTAACRLCQVEVTHPDWGGWTGMMTACLYPVAAGIEVRTRSPRVLDARRRVLALLAARCPRSEVIADLARKYGVTTEALHVDGEADNCILCGLCTRVCETFVTSAITTYGRGTGKAIGSFAEKPPEDCVGCGACAMICPTGHITDQRTETGYEIWGRTFETQVAAVDRTRCIGCGACEEACPFAVARVVLSADGRRVATIPRAHCVGCGACVGACPTGAIDQEGVEAERLAGELREAPIAVMACPRADLGTKDLGDGVRLSPVPCTGRISTSLLLDAVAGGSRGVLVLGRHQETCRLNGAEDPAADRVRRASEALAMVGLGGERVAFRLPDPGPEGPVREVERFREDVARLEGPAVELPPETWRGEGLDRDLAVLRRLSARPELRPDGAAWLDANGLPAATPGGTAVYPGVLPYVSVLADTLLDPLRVPDLLRAALVVLDALGEEQPGVIVGGCGNPGAHHASLFAPARRIYTFCGDEAKALEELGADAITLDQLLLARAAEIPRPAVAAPVACDGSAEAVALIEALGHAPVDLGPDPLPEPDAVSPVERAAAEARLAAAEAKGARALLVPDAAALVRWAQIARRGTWRSSRVVPVLAHQLAFLSITGLPLSAGALEAPVQPRAEAAEVLS